MHVFSSQGLNQPLHAGDNPINNSHNNNNDEGQASRSRQNRVAEKGIPCGGVYGVVPSTSMDLDRIIGREER
jgi:hypothetical protein